MMEASSVTFVEPGGYFRVDFSGVIDDAGLRRRHQSLLDALRLHLTPGATLKVLLDTREARFESDSVHRSMRDVFGTAPVEFAEHTVAVAILNPHNEGRLSQSEAYFTSEPDALAWLLAT